MHLNRLTYRANVPKVFSLLVLCSALRAGTILVTVAGSTQTQIAINYTATSTAACTVTATDQNNGPTVSDLDPTKFTGANQDLSRTVVNGFRWPALCGGLACSAANTDVRRTVFIGGHDEIKQASDGKWYSTALQVNSSHTITVTCAGGADIGTTPATTKNIPLASNYPELPIPTPGSPLGGMPQPTIDWSRAGRKAQYIDPITGVLIQRITGGSDYFDDTNPVAGVFQSTVLDVNGAAWTNPNNFITNQSAGTLTTTTTVNAPIFAAFAPAFVNAFSEHFTDFLVTPYGSASSPSVISEWCLSLDSGQTCANFTPLDVTYSTSAQCQPNNDCAHPIPSTVPSSFFSGWGGMKVAHGSLDMSNKSFTGVSASGSTVSIASPDDPRGPRIFYLGLAPGSKFTLTSCGSGTQAPPLTVATVNSPSSITTVESGLALTNCTYTDMHAGVRAILKNGGTLNVSFQAKGWWARGYTGGTSGSRHYCAKSKVTDIQTDCDGVTQGTPLSGYLCQFPAVLDVPSVFLVQDNGRMCLQGDLYSNGPPRHLSASFPSWVDNKSLLGVDFGSPKHIWKATHVANNYLEMPDDPLHTLDTLFTYTDLGVATANSSQVIALGGPAAAAVQTGIWPAFGLEYVTEDKNGNTLVQYNSQFGQNTMCMKAFTDVNGTVLSTMPGYGSYPLSYTACHSAPFGGGGYVLVGTQGDDSTLAPIKFSNAQTLGGPFVSNVIGVRKNGSWINTTLTITSCTKAVPAVCTSPGNNLDNIVALSSTAGALVTISGATGSGWSTGLNASLYAHKVDNNAFSLYTDPQGSAPLDSTGFGTLGGTITASLARPVYSLRAASITNSGGNARITVDTTEGGPQRYYPSIATSGIVNLMFDADPITIVQRYMNSTVQYYAKLSCAGCSNAQFDVYSNSSLTTPVPFGTLSGATGFYVMYAETCPDPATNPLPGPMYTDTGFGSIGSPKVRCVGVRLNSEMESNFPAAGEHSAYPPPPSSAEASNVTKSMLHQINVGDGMMDLSHVTGNHEILYTLSVNRSVSENQIDVVVMRDYGDDPNFGWRAVTNGPLSDTYAMQHSPGWTATGTGIISQVMFDPTTQPPTYFVPRVNGSHFDLVTGASPGTLTDASSYLPGPPDDVVDGSISTYINSLGSTHNSVPVFGSNTTFSWSGLKQSYPSKRTIPSQTAAGDRVWKNDWAAPNIDSGTGKNALDGGFSSRTLTNVSGIVWKIQSLSPINIKVAPIYAAAPPYNYFADKSGPSSSIGSGDNGRFCHAYNAGECVAGSSAGDMYIAATTLQSIGAASTQCLSNDATFGSPCVFGLWPGMGWALQIRQTPVDTNAAGMRRISTGFWPALGQYYAYNWVASPDAKWGFFAGNPIGQRPKSGEDGSNFFAMRLPPWPNIVDSVNRSNYVSIDQGFSGRSGDQIRIAFGYGENGDPGKFYCTTRQEKCWTSSAPTPLSPFAFDGETQHKTPCNSSCSVSIPAIPGRIVFYQIERSNGTDVHLGPIQATAIP